MGGGVDRHRLSEDPVQPETFEPVPDQLTRALAGQPLAPAAAQQPVTELGLTILRTLVSAGRRLEMPPAGELPRYEAGPVARPGIWSAAASRLFC